VGDAVKARVPSKATLKKYGLDEKGWLAILHAQGGVCPICEKVPDSGRMVTDHEHVRGFRKMSPEDRRRFTRGITCGHCNRFFLARGMAPYKAANLVTYLTAYEERREPQ
jgi:hypothetical protein